MTGPTGQEKRITVSLVERAGQWQFDLTHRGQTVPLRDSSSLNQWTAMGIVGRHNLHLSQDGVTIDGKQILYEAPRAVEELEHILNEPPPIVHPHAHHPGAAHAPHADAHQESAARLSEITSLGQSIHVSRDGFEYHVNYQTKFGEHKTEILESALEAFQNMRLFKPHVNLQKAGIRLVVTAWDGEQFSEEPGIENLEHATPAEVEAIIKRNLHGAPEGVTAVAPAPAEEPTRHIVRLEVLKKPHDARFHLVFHRQDGTTEEGPLLIRANLAKLQAEGLFRPGMAVSISTLNDRIFIERTDTEDGKPVKRTEAVPLETEEDGRKVAAALNQCLKPIAAPGVAARAASPPGTPPAASRAPVQTSGPEPAAAAPPVASASPRSAVPAPALANTSAPPKPGQAPPNAPPRAPAELAARTLSRTSPEAESGPDTRMSNDVARLGDEAPLTTRAASTPAPPVAKPQASGKEQLQSWLTELLATTSSLPPEEVSQEVFTALRTRLGLPLATNERGYPAITVHGQSKEGSSVAFAVVLLSHSLLCEFPAGYVRFGPETRVYLKRTDDFISFPNAGLRGVALAREGGAVVFAVSPEFFSFLGGGTAREYRNQFGSFLVVATQVSSPHELLWPLSREERLFQALAATAKGYGLPVTAQQIVFAPDREPFLGFKKVSPHGMEFRDGDDFVRFTPLGVELQEGGASDRCSAKAVLLGWALDAQGRICALYDGSTGFTPPPASKLLRFLSEGEKEAEAGSLNILAWLRA
ncbi:MAG: hypothetical protein HYY24_10330 [Verrucomicrobia bacterium]|nr:hypothetical protein [Verrucomicrobiota bacterium]